MRIGFTAAFTATLALFLASCQQGPQQPQGPLLQSSTGRVGLGSVPVGATSQAKTVTFSLDSAANNAQVFYPPDPFAGPNARELLVGPPTLMPRGIEAMGCTPELAVGPSSMRRSS